MTSAAQVFVIRKTMTKMSSNNGYGKPVVAGRSSLLGKPAVAGRSSSLLGKPALADRLGHGVTGINTNSAEGNGQRKVYSNKFNKKGADATKPRARGHINSKRKGNAGGCGNLRRTVGCNHRIPGSNQIRPTQAFRPPLQQGGNWANRSGGVYQFHQSLVGYVKPGPADIDEADNASDSDSNNQLHKKQCEEETYGKWNGLTEIKDREIVWPPMVIIKNTILDKDENEKWIGMGKQELLDYFSTYAATEARHSYGPLGHEGTSVLIFKDSAMGYLEAERLHKHFEEHGTDRDAWDHHHKPFCPDGKRQLYGFMARKEDLDFFHHGKMKLKFELRSYLENVVAKVKQMDEDNQELILLKGKFLKEQMLSKELEQSLCIVSEKLENRKKENQIARERTNMHHAQLKEQMDYQEQFYKDQIQNILKDNFEAMQQKECEKAKLSSSDKTSKEDHRVEEVEYLLKCQDKKIDFVTMGDKLMKIHSEKEAALKKRHGEEKVELDKELAVELNNLMEHYTPQTSDGARPKLPWVFSWYPF